MQGKSRPRPEISSLNGDAEKLTPYKSNGGHNYRAEGKPEKPGAKYCINVDWFEATLEGSWLPHNEMGDPLPVISKMDGNLILERDPGRWNGTKHYQFCYLVYLYGEPVATIITHPRNAIMGQRSPEEGTRALSQLRLENHLLYRSGWLKVYRAILEGLGVVLNNVTRVDISVDGGQFLEQYRALISGRYKKLGRAKHACHFTEKDEIEGFYIGSRSSDRYIRGYSKTREIRQAGGHKSYILNSWEKANLEAYQGGAGEVERLELVLKAKAIAQMEKGMAGQGEPSPIGDALAVAAIIDGGPESEALDIDRLEDDAYLAGVMRAGLEKFYQFVDGDELARRGNISRCARIDPVEWSYFDAEQLQRLATTKKPNVIWAVQRRITFDMLEYYAKLAERGLTIFDEGELQSAGEAFHFNRELAKSYGVLDWFERKLPYWQKRQDFHRMMKAERLAAKYRNGGVYHLKTAAI